MTHRILLVPALLFSILVGIACVIMLRQPVGVDFLSFWAAGRLTLEGTPSLAYDVAAHRAVEASAVAFDGMLPFPYPPALLFILAPFGWLKVGAAFVAWTILTGAFYLWASRLPIRAALAHPTVVANGFVGQTAFLTTGAFALGFHLLRARPFTAGAVLGLMSLKPQIALLVPVALVSGGHWRALAGAACSATLMLALSVITFGAESLTGFLSMLPRYTEYMAEGQWDWTELASLYAAASQAGAGPALAGAVHFGGAVFGLWFAIKAWRKDHEAKVPILAAATLLMPPYLFNYDALLLVIPFAWLLTRNPAGAMLTWMIALVAISVDAISAMALASLLSLAFLMRAPRGEDRQATRILSGEPPQTS